MDLSYNKYEVGQRIKNCRQSLGMSMTEFGKAIDDYSSKGKIKSGTVSNWETGKNLPTPERLKKISEICNVSVVYLLEGKKTYEDLSIEELQHYTKSYQNKDNLKIFDKLFDNENENIVFLWLSNLKLDSLTSDELGLIAYISQLIEEKNNSLYKEEIDSLIFNLNILTNSFFRLLSDKNISAEEITTEVVFINKSLMSILPIANSIALIKNKNTDDAKYPVESEFVTMNDIMQIHKNMKATVDFFENNPS